MTNANSQSDRVSLGGAKSRRLRFQLLLTLAVLVTIHYRFVGSNSVGVAFGADQVFTTAGVEDQVFKYYIQGFFESKNDNRIAITGYTGTNGAVIIPGTLNAMPVGIINPGAFNSLSSVTSVSVPDSVTSIENQAFYSCTNLLSVTIGNGITNIWDNAFSGCTNLRSVFFRGNAPSIGLNVFENSTTVYYMPGKTGWGSTLGAAQTVLWNPHVLTKDPTFGVRNNQFGFTVVGTADIPLVIEASNDLASWSWVALQNCTLTNGLLYFGDPQCTNFPSRFYRIRSP